MSWSAASFADANKSPEAVGAELRILRLTPAGEDAEPRSQIVIAFDRAVVPLGRMDRRAEEVPVTITPQLDCQWRWLDPQALACQLPPEQPLRPATAYTVEVRPEFVTEKGERLRQGFTQRFVTQRPSLSYSGISNWAAPGLPVTRLYFNQPVSAASIAASVTLGGEKVEVLPNLHDSQTPYYLPGDAGGNEARREWRVRPQRPLPPDRDGSLRVKPGLRSAFGTETGIENREALKFHTFADFAFVGLRCYESGNGKEIRLAATAVQTRLCDPLAGAALLFSVPVAADELKAAVRITPDPAGGRTDYDPWAGYGGSPSLSTANTGAPEYDVSLPFTLQADAEYQVDGGEALKDAFGRALGHRWGIRFRTAQRSPRLAFAHSTAVLEQGVDSEVPAIVTNLQRLILRYTRITAQNQDGGDTEVPIAPVKNIAYAIPLGVRQMLKGESGVLDGYLRSAPSTRDESEDEDEDSEESATPDEGRRFFAEVTPWQVHVKLGHYGTLVWVTEFASGKPVPLAEVSIYAAQRGRWTPAGNVAPATARTDADGLAELPGTVELDPQLLHSGWRPQEPLAVRVVKGKDFALIPLTANFNVDVYRASDYTVSTWRRPRYGHLKSWGTTAQGVYRAGDSIQYKIYVRNETNQGLAAAQAGPYRLQIYDPADQLVYERGEVQLSEFGAFDGEFTVPKQGKVGWYRFQLTPLFRKTQQSPDEDDGDEDSLQPLRVLVSDFTPAPFKLSTEIRAPRALPGQPVTAVLRVSLHAGGPYSGAPATLSARVVAAPVELGDSVADSFWFGSYQGIEGRDAQAIVSREAQTDRQGEFSASLNMPEGKIAWGRLEVEGTAQDDRGRAIASVASVPYAGRDRLIGLRNQDWLLQEGKPTQIETLVIDAEGKPVAGTPYYVKVERREVTMARIKDVGNAYVARYSERWEKVEACKGRSLATPSVCGFTPDKGGSYRVTAMTRDTANRLHTSSLWLWASGKNTFLWEEPDDYGLELVPDKTSYKIGDTARFLVKNPYPGATALITTERFGVIEKRTQRLEGSAPVVEVPIKPDHVPGFYLSVVVQSPRVKAPPPEGDVDLGKPTFRMGYAKVEVDDPYKQLKVTVRPEHEQYQPREKARVRLSAVPRVTGSGEKIELAVAVLDEAVFDLIQGGEGYFDPYKGFMGLEALDLANYSLLTRLVGRQKFEKKGATPGGDGGVDLSLRSVDKFVAYWNPHLATDDKGEASFEFELPDNLTAWKVLALATTPSDRLGLGSGLLKVSKDTELRPLMPNQVTSGDRFQAGFSVLNRSDKPRTLKLQLKAEGPLATRCHEPGASPASVGAGASGSAATPASGSNGDKCGAASATHEETVGLKGFERRSVYFEVAPDVKDNAEGKLVFTAVAGDAQDRDALKVEVPVRPRRPTVTAADYGSLDGGPGHDVVKQPIAVPAGILPGGEIALSFTPTVLGNLDGAFKYVRDYPYLCWEQRLTKGVMAAYYGKLKGYLDPGLEWAKADQLIGLMFNDAASFQAANGGMSFWDGDESHVSPYLSAYTALAFEWLRGAGYAPPKAVQDKLDGYLDQLLRKDVPDYSLEASSAVRAVALASLASRGKLHKPDLDRYAPALPRMGLFGQAMFLQAAQNTPDASELVRNALDSVLSHANESAGQLVLDETEDSFWSLLLGSPLRSNCAALAALAALPDQSLLSGGMSELPMKLVRAITQARGGRDHWENTQENVYCLAALNQYAQRYEASAPDMRLRATLDGQSLGPPAQFKSLRDRPVTESHPIVAADIGQRRELSISHEGQGRAYYAARLSYVEKDENAQAANAGLTLKRSYSVKRDGQWVELGGQPLASPMHIKRGELVRVELTLSAPAERYFVVVDDPLPGGLEPVNPDLATASGLAAEEAEPPGAAYPYPFYHRELRFEAARWFADRVPPGDYRLYWIGQAVAVGEFALPAPHAEQMYDPDVFGNDVPGRLLVEEAAARAPDANS